MDSRSIEDVKARGLGGRAWYWLLAPIPRRWSSAWVLALASVLLVVVAPEGGEQYSSFSSAFPVTVAGQRILLMQARGHEEERAEVWWVMIRGEYSQRMGFERFLVKPEARQLSIGATVEASPQLRDRIARAWASHIQTTRYPAQPYSQMILDGVQEMRGWNWRSFASEFGGWAGRLLLISAVVLGMIRAWNRGRFEGAIARWYEGRCPRCGYSLEGIAEVSGERRCPECGTDGAAHVRFVDGILRAR